MGSNDHAPRSYKSIASEILPSIIEKDLGKDAKLLAWESDYFTKKGDNFLGKIKGVHCKVSATGKEFEVYYVVKLNPRRPLEVFQRMTQSFFVKEGKYLYEVAPILNNILAAANFPSLSIPECTYASFKSNEEIILLKDLRRENYKMVDKMKPLDANHIILVAEELAKQHAASYVHYLQSGATSLNDMFPYMQDLWLDEKNPGAYQYINYCKMRISSSIKALEQLKFCPKGLKWLKEREKCLFNIYVDEMVKSDKKFNVICHGDLWTNNIMFRYSDDSKPVRVVLLDFQQCRIGSLFTDLYILLSATTTINIRRQCMDELFTKYYKTFSEIVQHSGEDIPFSLKELQEEYKNRSQFGLICSILRLPLLLNDEDVEDLNDMDAEGLSKFIEHERSNLYNMLCKNAILRERYFSAFEAAMDSGLF